MFDSQSLGHVICSNRIDYNLILIFKGDVLINFKDPHVPLLWPLALAWGRS